MIRSVLKSPNGIVLVFDENAEQIPEYQGQYEDVRNKILRDAPPDAAFGYIVTQLRPLPRRSGNGTRKS